MAGKAISQAQAQRRAINSGVLDLMGSDESTFKVVTLDSLAGTLAELGLQYALKLRESLNKADASSSGKLADSIIPLEVKVFGSTYTVEIQAAKYASFIDEGVNGWSKARGSKYSFKTKGIDPKGEMVKSIKAWLIREGNISRITTKATTKRETKQKSITDASTKAAISTAYMIKRQGIKPTHFWRDATKEMKSIVEMELGKALKIDIINSITA